MDAMQLDEESVFHAARRIADPEARNAYLGQACGEDARLRRRVERLLRVCEAEAGFLATTPCAATVEFPREAEEPETSIGPYRLLEAIGEGGMGVVYVAEQVEPVRRRVALKVIKPGMDSRQVVARFEAERQALAMMDHPNIARVLDGGMTPSGRPYFVMELVRGLPITEYCDGQQLSIAERLDLFVLVCRAVQHAHQKGVIHRDLKPSNVLVTVIDGAAVPKVIDFGVAKAAGGALTDRTLYTGFHQFVGTPLYASPEQAELSGVDVDTRSDIYSLGVLLYELLTGTTPFDPETLKRAAFDEMRRILREEEPPRPSTRLSTLGGTLSSVSARRKADPKRLAASMKGELDWVVMKALEKDRRRRYETAGDFAADVMRYLSDRPVEAFPPSNRYRFAKFARRNRAALTTAALVGLAAAVGTATSVWQAARAAQAAGEAERRAGDLRQVVAYLARDLFGAAAPGKTGRTTGRSMTVGQMLDRADDELGRRFRGQPLVEAALRVAFAQSYMELMDYDRAERSAARAVELLGRHLGPGDPETLAALDLQAQTLMEAGWDYVRPKAEAAERLFRRALAGRRRVLGPAHPDTLLSQIRLAITVSNLGRHAEGDALATHAAELAAAADDPNIEVAVDTRHIVGLIAGRRGDLERAEPLIREGRMRREQIYGPLHRQTLCGMLDLAEVLRLQGRLDEAREVQAEAVDRFAQAYGLCHIQTVPQMQKLIAILRQQGDLAAIREAYQGWMRAILATPAEADPYQRSRRSIMLSYLALELATLSEPIPLDEGLAVRAAEEAVALAGDDDNAWQELAAVYYRLGRLEEATQAVRKSVAWEERKRESPAAVRYGQASSFDFDTLLLALIHARRGEMDQARAWYGKVAKDPDSGSRGVAFRQLLREANALLAP